MSLLRYHFAKKNVIISFLIRLTSESKKIWKVLVQLLKLNANRLFYESCFALIKTAFSFAIAAGILDQQKTELQLTASQVGLITSMWFAGFPISMVIGDLIYHKVDGKAIMQFAFFAHAVGILLLIFSGSYVGLLVANLLIGLGNGCTEAACNPMIADA